MQIWHTRSVWDILSFIRVDWQFQGRRLQEMKVAQNPDEADGVEKEHRPFDMCQHMGSQHLKLQTLLD